MLLVLLVVASTFSLAGSVVEVTPIVNQITPSQEAKFSLKITNQAMATQRYSIYSLSSGQGWAVDPSPLKDRIVELAPKQTHTTMMIARPLEQFTPGIYKVGVTVESDLGERHDEELKMYVATEGPVNYLPSFKVGIDMNEKISPKDPVLIKLFLENRNPLNLTGLKISMRSDGDMPEFVREAFVDVPPLEKKSVDFSVTPNEFQQPKEYTLFFVFERLGETVKVEERNIEIISLLPEFSVEPYEEEIFFRRFYLLSIKNGGNVRNTQEVKFPISTWQTLFTKSSGKVKEIDGNKFLTWQVALGANEATTINFDTNYRPLFYVLVIILLFGLFYCVVKSPVVVNKEATTKKSGEDGALSQIKIKLNVQNKSRRPLKGVTVTDLVPAIANVEKRLELGTLKPHDIKHTKQGTRVTWNIAELDGHEHRIITYTVKAKLNILGTFSLPRATVNFGKRWGKHSKAYSNIFRLKQ